MSIDDDLQLPSVTGESLPAQITPSTPQLYDRVDAGEVQLPSIYLQAALSKAVQSGTCKPGDVILALGADDPDPVFLIGGPEGRESFDAYIVSRKRVFTTTRNGRLEFLPARDFDDPDCWEGFNYLLSIPTVDDVIPARLLLTRMAGRIASKRLNFFIDRQLHAGSDDPAHVRFTISSRTNNKGHNFHVFQTASIPPGEDVEVARAMREYASFMQRGMEDAA